MKKIPLIDGLFLLAWRHGNDYRFAQLFVETWTRFPTWAQTFMKQHWFRVRRSPAIAYLAAWPGNTFPACWPPDDEEWKRRRHIAKPGTYAAMSHGGHLLRFHAPIVDRMPDPYVHDLIAHELAHVLQYAKGYKGTRGQMERDADDTLLKLGFQVNLIDAWAQESGIVEQGEPETWREFNQRMERSSRYA